MSRSEADVIRPMDASEIVLTEALSSIRRPDGYCIMTLDLQAAEEFRRIRAKQTGIELTMLDLFIRAAALAWGRDTPANKMAQGRKIVNFKTTDIGISVAATTAVAPVAVLREVDDLSLEEIHQRRTALVKEILEGGDKRRREMEQLVRFCPLPPVRRRLLGWLMNQTQFRREAAGTIQITSIDLPDIDFYLPCHMTTTLLLSVGGVKPMPMVVNGQIQVRLGVQVACMIDQRVIHPVRGMRYFRRFRRCIEEPWKLLKSRSDKAAD